jgi:hypothetical protein
VSHAFNSNTPAHLAIPTENRPAEPRTKTITMRKLTFYHRHGSDYLDTYGADARIAERILGLTLLAVHKSHATKEHPAGIPHTAIPLYVKDAWFTELRAHGCELVIAAR